MNTLTTTRSRSLARVQWWTGVKVGLLVVLLGAILILAPLPGGDDWASFMSASRRLVAGERLYGVPDPHYYANPPYVAALLAPLAWLPLQVSFALSTVLTLLASMRLIHLWCEDDRLFKATLTMLSPPMFYILLHGQIDVLVLAGVLLPSRFWILTALAKPQGAIGLVMGIERKEYSKAVMISGAVLVVCFLLWGNWVHDMLAHSDDIAAYGQNYWQGLWPFQVPQGVFFILQGMRLKDNRLLVAASPFCVPYAAPSSFIGAWIVAMSYLDRWQVAALWCSWWGCLLLRAYGSTW
ncbi:MAG: hypothetical protein K8L91_01550 [Anaerolineae bacterium]|nr:hypothetical protein [Anaerolineae bacterium]